MECSAWSLTARSLCEASDWNQFQKADCRRAGDILLLPKVEAPVNEESMISSYGAMMIVPLALILVALANVGAQRALNHALLTRSLQAELDTDLLTSRDLRNGCTMRSEGRAVHGQKREGEVC